MSSNSTVTSASTSSGSGAAASSSFAASVSSSIASAVSSSVLSGSTTTVQPSSTSVVTSIVSASGAAPTTNIITSIVTQSATKGGLTDTNPVTVIVTSVGPASTTNIIAAGSQSSSTGNPASSTPSPASLSNNGTASGSGGGASSGLSTAGTVAVAVVVPVVAVFLLVLAGILLWRKRKQRREQQEQRQREINDYAFNPNNDPTLPVVAAQGPEMAQDGSNGYRGWGAATASTRKASTTLSGGHTQGQLSDSGNSYGNSPASVGAAGSDGHSSDPLVNQRDTMGSDDLAALGAAPAANQNPGVRRGPSNASSAYSNGARSDHSDEPPPLPTTHDYIGNAYGYSQHGPYGDGTYGGTQPPEGGMPVVRDVSARRNTRILQPGNYQQGNSGIAQNF